MNYHNITKYDMLNGDGLRTVLWVAGCVHHCQGCQNPQTWDANGGILFDNKAKKELFDALSEDCCDGITLSGGDPLNGANIRTICKLIGEIQEAFPEKSIWLYSGYTWNEIMHPKHPSPDDAIRKAIVKAVDFFCDGRFEIDKLNIQIPWVGSTNQKVIDVQKSLCNKEIALWKS